MKNQQINIAYLNFYHLCNKVTSINVLLTSTLKGTHIMGIGESRLKDFMDDKQLHIENYSIIRRDKTHDNHTGIAAYIHNSIYHNVKRRSDLDHKDIECLWVELIQEKSIPSLICFLYRNPEDKGKALSEWQTKFQEMIEKIPHKNYELQILGDLNIDLHLKQPDWDAITTQLGLEQLIQETTRETITKISLIDHIYTNTRSKIINTKVLQTKLSDHYTIYCTYLLKLPKAAPKEHKYMNYRSYKHFNENEYLSYLGTLPFGNIYQYTDPQEALLFLSNLLKLAINKHVPIKTKRVKHSDIPAWLSNKTIEAMRIRDTFNKKTQNEEFKQHRNTVNNMVKKDKKHYFDNMIENKKDTKTIWKAMNNITGSNKKGPKAKIDLDPNEINDFFLNLPKTILTPEVRNHSENFECSTELIQFCQKQSPNEKFSIPFITIPEVGKLISNLKNTNAVGPDEIPVNLLKIALPHIIEPLTYFYNLCIGKNCFPSQLKEAKVIPLPKSQDTSHPKNIRPISLLPILSKPLESHIHKHMYQHLDKYNLLHKYQSGFRPKHSCQTALVKLIDDWLSAINKSEFIGTVYLDFKKAFDLVNHNILLTKLNQYFPTSQITEFIKSYLTNRSQFVLLNGKKSQKKEITSGVPQGSVLGPLFFLVYINDLPLHLNQQTENTLFADDSSLYTSNKQMSSVNNILQDSLNKTLSWCNRNSMVIHPDKTKCMIIAPRQKQQLHKPVLSLTLGNKNIEQVNEHKLLGVTIDTCLTWNKHIEIMMKKLSRNIFLLYKLRQFVQQKHLHLFFNAHIMSHVNYASTIWDGCSQDTFKKLNALRRRAVKQINSCQITATDKKLKKLNILPLKKQLDLNKIILIHKIYNNRTPTYLNEIITKASSRYNSKKLIVPHPKLDLFKTSLSFSGSILWNSLPNDLKCITSVKSFKKKMYSFFFNNQI